MPKKKPDIPSQVIDAALALAATRGWRALNLAEIAEAAKLPLSQVYSAYTSKAAILRGFTRRIDAAVHSMKDVPTWLPDGLEISTILPREDPRDALFSAGGQGLAGLPAVRGRKPGEAGKIRLEK